MTRKTPTANRMTAKAVRMQQGQSMVELLVVLGTFLVPALLIVPVLSQMISLRQDAESAARYVTWERSVWLSEAVTYDEYLKQLGSSLVRSDATLAEQVDHRLLSAADKQIYSSASNTDWKLDPFDKVYSPTERKFVSLVKQKDGSSSNDPRFSTVSTTDNAPPGSIASVLDGIVGTLGAVGSFDLNTKGYIKSTYSVDLIRVPWLEDFDLQALSYQTTNVMLTDGWNPTGKGHAESRIRGLLPQAILPDEFLDFIQEGLSLIPWFAELDDDSLMIGQVNVDPVPDHRLSEYKP